MEQDNTYKIIALASGRGSNFVSIHDFFRATCAPVKIIQLITDNPDAAVIEKAKDRDVPVTHINYKGVVKSTAEHELLQQIQDGPKPDLIILVGFMRVLSVNFLTEFYATVSVPILNIHPSILPKFKGLDTHRRVLEAGNEHIHGASVHLVSEKVDEGPVIAQTIIPILKDDTEDVLAARVLDQEHTLFITVIEHLVNRSIWVGIKDKIITMNGMNLFSPIQYIDNNLVKYL